MSAKAPASTACRPADEGLDRSLRLSDGRRLCYREFGACDGFPVIALHGTPGSRLKYAATHDQALRLGLRLISPDRWGYGGSDAAARATLAGYAADIDELAGRLGLGLFSVAGISGGGPFAAAVAAGLGSRVAKLALISPVGPIAGAVPARELRPFHRFCFSALPRMPGAVWLAFSIYRAALAADPGTAVLLSAQRAASIDRATLRDRELRARLGETFHVGLAGGVRGPVIDMGIFSAPWNLALERISAATRLWVGTEDRNVPVIAAQRLAARTGAELMLLGGQGHFWFSRHYTEVLAWLAGDQCRMGAKP